MAPPHRHDGLHTVGPLFYKEDGTLWSGRGVNVHDTRGCDACTGKPPDVAEVKRRLDDVLEHWHANFLRLLLESYSSSDMVDPKTHQKMGTRLQYQSVLDDKAYLRDLEDIVNHITQKPGVYVLLSLWKDGSFDAHGAPTEQTTEEWTQLATTFKDNPGVLFGVANEPEDYDNNRDPVVWKAMDTMVAAIRAVEDKAGVPHHIAVVQGTQGWGRLIDYYVTHPIKAGGGDNVAYETHAYDNRFDFDRLIQQPHQRLPIIIGEFGPSTIAHMSLEDCTVLMDLAESTHIPYVAWTFHPRCGSGSSLLQDGPQAACGPVPLVPTSPWGRLVKDRLSQAPHTEPVRLPSSHGVQTQTFTPDD